MVAPRRGAPGLVLLVLVSLVDCTGPLGREPREPARTWFRAYSGPMLPESAVAILCKQDPGAHIVSVWRAGDPAPSKARYEKWHFPICIEVLPGTYELTIRYFARENKPGGRETYTTEAPPIALEWVAEPGAYLLTAELGRTAPTPGRTYRKPKHYGAAHGEWAIGHWQVRIDPVASLDQMQEPVREYRETWRRYETSL